MKRKKEREAVLTNQKVINVRFSDLDPMQVVWHGQYVRYLEDGREAFGRQYQIGYNDVSDAGYYIPIVELSLQYKQSLRYGEKAIVETRYIKTAAAKIIFDYTIYRESDHSIAATATSTQVFTDKKTGRLELNNPDFYIAWQEKWGIR